MPALPASGMEKLEEVLLDQFPSNVKFEELWEECVLSILCLLDTNIGRTYCFLVSIIKFSPAILNYNNMQQCINSAECNCYA